MKITKYLWLIFVIGLYVSNYYWFKIDTWSFTGIVLGILLVLVVAINIIVKIKNRKGKTDDNFIFPDKVADVMKVIDMETQYEASILSLFCLIVGMILFTIYIIFLAPYHWLMKIFISLNTFMGVILMGSMLVTNYQQFISHKQSKQMLADLSKFSNINFPVEIMGPDKLNPGVLKPLPNMPLSDVDAAIVHASSHQIPDYDLFVDHCHLNENGNKILQETISTTILKSPNIITN